MEAGRGGRNIILVRRGERAAFDIQGIKRRSGLTTSDCEEQAGTADRGDKLQVLPRYVAYFGCYSAIA